MKARNSSIRIAAMLAAVAMTTLTLGLQFGLVWHYTAKVEAAVAAKRTAPVAQTTATQRPGAMADQELSSMHRDGERDAARLERRLDRDSSATCPLLEPHRV